MEIINPITNSIIKNAKDGETIRSLAEKTGFAYSAVYKWVMALKDYDIIHLIEKGNKNIVKINKNNIYKRFVELDSEIGIIEKDRIFWNIIKKTKLRARFIESTAAVIWTQGSYITGDFLDKVYFLEVYSKDLASFQKILEKSSIVCSEDKVTDKRPFVFIKINKKKFKPQKLEGLPVVPLQKLVKWCQKLELDNILEQLDSIYDLKLNADYSEIKTNI